MGAAIGMMLSHGPTIAPGSDPYWSNTVLLCHFEGTDGTQTPTPVDTTGRHTLGFAGTGSKYGSAQKKFGTTSLDNTAATSGTIRTTLASSDFNFGAGQFTVEAWAYFTTLPGTSTRSLIAQWGAGSQGWELGMLSGALDFTYSTTGSNFFSVGAAWTPTLNTWYHIAADRDASNVLRVYLNGAVFASATVTATIFAATTFFNMGNDGLGTRTWQGYVDDVRITKGVARYAGAFTPPTAAYPDS